MTSVRQISGLWSEGQTRRLVAELVRYRAEFIPELAAELGGSAVAAAALAVIRLHEYDQSHLPVFAALLGKLLASQETDGSWGDPVLTALASRALLCWPETLPAARRGMDSLGSLQREDGSLPRTSLRRLVGDAMTTAFVLAQLGSEAEFTGRFRIGAAIYWLGSVRDELSPGVRQLARTGIARSLPNLPGQAQKLARLVAA
jgi:hypothetical protein